jgi:carotenoid cleavage dioxygenase-like enzyme
MPEANLAIINAHENEDGTIIFDAIRSADSGGEIESSTQWPWASTLGDFQNMSSKKSLWRYHVHPQKGFISKDCISQDQLYFGVVNPSNSAQKHRYIYAAAGAMGEGVAPPQGITKFDIDSGSRESWFPES